MKVLKVGVGQFEVVCDAKGKQRKNVLQCHTLKTFIHVTFHCPHNTQIRTTLNNLTRKFLPRNDNATDTIDQYNSTPVSFNV